MGEQSIGKSALTRMQNVLISKVIEADNETRQKSDEYTDECIAAGEGKEKPKDPHYGTPKAVKHHYKNAEDGLVTRVSFCSYPQGHG